MKLKLFFTTILFLFSFLSIAQYSVLDLNAKKEGTFSRGIFYSLPKNSIKVNISVKKTEFTPGIFSAYAENLLGIDNSIDKYKTVHEINNIEFSSTSYPDDEEVYYIYANEREGYLPNIIVLDNGIIESVNVPFYVKKDLTQNKENNKFNTNNSKEAEGQNSTVKKNELDIIKAFHNLNIYEIFDTITTSKMVDTVLVVKKVLKPRTIERTSAQKAKELANLIIEARKQKAELISGYNEQNYSPETIKFMFEALDKNERMYTELFVGSIKHQTQHYSFEIIPNADNTYRLAWFSTSNGLTTSPNDNIYKPEIVQLELLNLGNMGTSIVKFEPKINASNKGIRYKVPMDIRVSLMCGDKELAKEVLKIAQRGKTACLPIVKNNAVIFDSKTGGILYFGNKDFIKGEF